MPFRLYACRIRKYGQRYHSVYRDSICVHDVGVTLQCPRCSEAMLERDRWHTSITRAEHAATILGLDPVELHAAFQLQVVLLPKRVTQRHWDPALAHQPLLARATSL